MYDFFEQMKTNKYMYETYKHNIVHAFYKEYQKYRKTKRNRWFVRGVYLNGKDIIKIGNNAAKDFLDLMIGVNLY